MTKRSVSKSSMRSVPQAELRAVTGGLFGVVISAIKEALKEGEQQEYLKYELKNVQVTSY